MLRRPLLAVALLCTSAAACNAVTGVDDLSLPAGHGGPGSAGAGSAAGAGGGQGGSGSGAPAPQVLPAKGVTIDEIAIYQGVKRDIMGGQPSSSGVVVPIVAGRDALVRVFVQTGATYDGGAVTAHLFLGANPKPIEVVGVVGASNDADLTSTINFDVPGASLVPSVAFRVELEQPAAHGIASNAGASYSMPLDVMSDGPQIKIALVPIVYGADGSNRLPDTSPSQIQGYKDKYMGVYPIVAIDLQMHAQMQWNEAVDADGNGWGDLLDGLESLRQSEGAPLDLYYYGIFQPGSSFDDWCGGGCVAGLGQIGQAQDNTSRAAIGLGYSDPTAFTTAIHEIGHTQGRYHAPCGNPAMVDPAFPYATGGIGVWGYDIVMKQLISPDVGHDMMGYCQNDWISDYTFSAIFDRMQTVNQAEIIVPEGQRNLTWQRVRVEPDGSLSWRAPITMARPPIGQPVNVTIQAPGGATTVIGQFFPYDHIPGGVLYWRAAGGARDASGIQVSLDGKVSTLSR